MTNKEKLLEEFGKLTAQIERLVALREQVKQKILGKETKEPPTVVSTNGNRTGRPVSAESETKKARILDALKHKSPLAAKEIISILDEPPGPVYTALSVMVSKKQIKRSGPGTYASVQ